MFKVSELTSVSRKKKTKLEMPKEDIKVKPKPDETPTINKKVDELDRKTPFINLSKIDDKGLRNEIEKVPGTWGSATFNYNNWDSGRESLYTEANRKLAINTDWLNEDEAAWLEELFTSINVQILADNNIVYPVILTDKSYIKKTSVNNKIKIQYTINLEYANKIRTNS